MGRRPREEPLTVRFHKIAESQDPAWDDWMERGDPCKVVIPLPGFPPWSGEEIKARSDEYEKILVRLNARYTEYRDYRLAIRAEELAAQEGADRTDPASIGKKAQTQEWIAKLLSEEFGFRVSPTRVSRALIDLNDGVREWISGSTHSVTGPTSKPRPRSD